MSAPITERLHEQLHKLPGMPPHSEAERLNQNLPAKDRHAHHHDRHYRAQARHAGPPRVLVAWQNWIGGLFAGRGGLR